MLITVPALPADRGETIVDRALRVLDDRVASTTDGTGRGLDRSTGHPVPRLPDLLQVIRAGPDDVSPAQPEPVCSASRSEQCVQEVCT